MNELSITLDMKCNYIQINKRIKFVSMLFEFDRIYLQLFATRRWLTETWSYGRKVSQILSAIMPFSYKSSKWLHLKKNSYTHSETAINLERFLLSITIPSRCFRVVVYPLLWVASTKCENSNSSFDGVTPSLWHCENSTSRWFEIFSAEIS